MSDKATQTLSLWLTIAVAVISIGGVVYSAGIQRAQINDLTMEVERLRPLNEKSAVMENQIQTLEKETEGLKERANKHDELGNALTAFRGELNVLTKLLEKD